MQELNTFEIEEVNGAGFFDEMGYFIGYVIGRGMATRRYIDSLDNPMLGAMQYGA